MKNLIKVALVAIVMNLGVNQLFAQATKFGHINSAELLSMMPEIKEADKTLQTFGTQLESQLKTMTTEYQSKVEKYQGEEAMMADAIKQSKVKEITDLEGRIQEFQQTAQESVSKKKEELYSPILKKAEDAINSVAKENGFAYVFDKSVGAVIYAQDSDNIMDLVKKKLNITGISAPANSPATSGSPIKPAPKK